MGRACEGLCSTIHGRIEEEGASSSATDVSRADVATPPLAIPPSAHPPAIPMQTNQEESTSYSFIFQKIRIAEFEDARKLRERHAE